MRRLIRSVAVGLLASGAAGGLAGCQDEAKTNPAAVTAQEALGVSTGQEKEKVVESTRDVTVVKDTKVIDNKTGEVLSEKKEATPVTISETKEVKRDVNVKVGEKQATAK